MKKHVLAAAVGATTLLAGAFAPATAQNATPSAVTPPAGRLRGDVPPPPPIGPMRGGGLMRADANRDGVVTRAEVIADADRRFAALDTNGDGKVSRDEMRAARDARRGDGTLPPVPAGADGVPPTPRADGAPPRPGADRGDRPRGGMNRVQTRDEARERALRVFDRADTNRDGRVDQQEMDAMRLMMRARFAGSNDGDDRRGPPPGDEQP